MSMSRSIRKSPVSPVLVELEDLKQGRVPFSSLEEAFGPQSLGIIIVNGLPSKYVELRRRLLSYSSYLANLPTEVLKSLESPDTNYLVGWSLGKETLRSGHYDILKGSYYINCASSNASVKDNNFPEYTSPSIWPPEHVLPHFRETCEELCSLIVSTAALVAKECDRYGTSKIQGYTPGYLEHVVRTSSSTKARLLHYFPSSPSSNEGTHSNRNSNEDEDEWCATHVDHGCLTGLTSAMYVDEQQTPPSLPPSSSPDQTPQPLPEMHSSPDPKAGLYIRDRSNHVTQVHIPKDCLAFQTGEALELITQGNFKAVPHFVHGVSADGKRKVARNTLAVFTQPNLGEFVDRERGLTFAEFSKEVIGRNK